IRFQALGWPSVDLGAYISPDSGAGGLDWQVSQSKSGGSISNGGSPGGGLAAVLGRSAALGREQSQLVRALAQVAASPALCPALIRAEFRLLGGGICRQLQRLHSNSKSLCGSSANPDHRPI